jgi:coniferyl-aldehyde dehydrogenase
VIPLLPGPAVDEARHRIAPHIVLDAPPDCALMQREIFGPILPLLAYRELDEVIATINAGPGRWRSTPSATTRPHRPPGRARDVGGVTINDALMHVGQDDLPFGGVGESGMGHYHGYEGFQTFSKLRPVYHQARLSSGKLLTPPYGRLADFVLRFLTR